jgi:16S rRNA processing protein RimM
MHNNSSYNIHSKPTRKVGFVLKSHGFNGHLKLSLNDDYSPSDFLLINFNSKFVPFRIENFNPNANIVKLSLLDSIDDVQTLVNADIVDFQSDNESNDDDNFENYTLIDTNTGLSFNVLGIVELPNNTLIEFRHNHSDHLLPFHEDFILEIDHDSQTIRANFPDGLLDL